jgi:predicted double-glycine peptidase
MTDWLISLALLAAVVVFFIAGRQCRNLPRAIWVTLFAIPIFFWLILKYASLIPSMAFDTPIFTWMLAWHHPFIISSFVIAFASGILIPQVPGRRLRVMLCVLLAAGMAYDFVIPIFGPLAARHRLMSIHSQMSGDVCMQSTSWTCGAASAVTALHALGIKADEGEMAILACTAPLRGTNETLLARAIESRYGSQDVTTSFEHFRSVRDLRHLCPAIVSIRVSSTTGHIVAVLDVTDSTVVYGDPLAGKMVCSIEDFEASWFNSALLVCRPRSTRLLVMDSHLPNHTEPRFFSAPF